MIRNRIDVLALCAGLCLAAPSAFAHRLSNGRVTAVLNDPGVGATVPDQDRVDSLAWINSAGASTGNVVRNGGSFCGDLREYFGQSYGEAEGTTFFLVVGGTASKWSAPAGGLSGTSTTFGTNACVAQQGKVTTGYTLSTAANRVNALRIRRTFAFNAAAAGVADNLRGYVARLPYATVLVPDATGAVQSFNAGCCGSATEVASWNGKWFADDDGAGNGVVVIRDRSSTAPAAVAIDNDSISASNNTSIVLKRPAAGWQGTLVETEWLCFYDAKSWPAARRAAGKLPTGCAVPTR